MFISRREKAGFERNFALIVENFNRIIGILENVAKTDAEQNNSIEMLLDIDTTHDSVIESLTERIERLEAGQNNDVRLS